MQIINGELYIKTKDEKKIKAAQQLGIQVNPFDITDDGELLSTKANLKLINGEGTLAFDQATNLREINLPNSISEIGIFAFRNTQISELTVPKNVQTISVLTFGNCSKLKKIVLQEGLKTIEGNAIGNSNNNQKSSCKSKCV